MPSDCRYLASLPVTTERRGGSFAPCFSSLASFSLWVSPLLVDSLLASGTELTKLLGRLEFGTVILTSGKIELLGDFMGDFGGSGVEAPLSTEAARGGAGTTPVIPSGPSGFSCACRRRSAAPPGRGLKALAADAAFQKAPATSPFDFFDLIMGPRPGRLSSSSPWGDVGFSTIGEAVFAGTGVVVRSVAGAVGGIGAALPISGNTCFATSSDGSVNATAGATVARGWGISRSRRLPVRDAVPDCWLIEFLRDMRSALRGGGTIGSLLNAGLISGGGTRSRSCGRDGSIGGRLLSGGGFSSCCS